MLYSYEYLRKKKVTDFEEYFQLNKRDGPFKIMIDSGGFTINNNASEWPLERCIQFRDEYIAWLIRNKESINIAAELDLTAVLTKEQLEDWRENYFLKLTKDHGISICYIWHNGEKQSDWIALCKKYDYVGLAGAQKWDTAKLSSYCRIARKYKAKVHAFGFTRPEPLVKMRPYSADSTAWINAMKYGTTFILDKNNFRVYDLHNKDIRNRYKRKYQKMGIDWSLIKKDDSNETTKASIMEWVLLEKWINKRIAILKEKSAIAKPDVAKDAALSKTDSSSLATVSPSSTLSLIRTPDAAQLVCVSCHIGEECFAGETKVITWDGIKRIDSLVDTSPLLLMPNGTWQYAPIKSFGKKKLWKIELERYKTKKTIYATEDHGWFVKYKGLSDHRNNPTKKLTKELEVGHRLRSSLPICRKQVHPSQFGIAHGIVFGDGCLHKNNPANGSFIQLYGKKDKQLFKYFEHSPHTVFDNYIRANALPKFFKQLPSIDESYSYLYGWLAGYFAADGSVTKQGSCSISSVDKNALRFAQNVCLRLGIATYPITKAKRNITTPQGNVYEEHTIYKLPISPEKLTEEFFLIKKHKIRWRKRINVDTRRHSYLTWRVTSVEPTNRVEETYCATVENYKAFTLEDYILTSNCARYNEKSTKCNYPLEPFPGDIESVDPLVRVQITILKTDWDVWQRNIQFQQQQGGYTDRSIAAQGTQLFNNINALRESLKAKGPGGGLAPDAPSLTSPSKSGLSELFAGLSKALANNDEPDLKPVVTIDQPTFEETVKPLSPVETHNRDIELAHTKRESHGIDN
jgi:hypothetical protein